MNTTNPVVVGAATKKDHYDRAFQNTVDLYAGALALSGQAVGGIPYFSTTTAVAALAAGGVGRFLKANGTGVAPSWGSPAGLIIALGG